MRLDIYVEKLTYPPDPEKKEWKTTWTQTCWDPSK